MSAITVEVTETPIEVTTDGSGEIVVTLNPTTISVEASTTGPQGPSGIQGTVGIQGPAGTSQVIYYHHIQASTSNTWEINHNLGWYPNVTVVDSAGTVVEGEIEYLSIYGLRLIFSSGFSGNAYLS